MTMKCPVEARCIVCPLTFCCANCRWKHEQTFHQLKYDCFLCRGLKYLCKPEDCANREFIKHIAEEHLPLHCGKCNKIFTEMEELVNIDKCVSLSELLERKKDGHVNSEVLNEVDAKFDFFFGKAPNSEEIDDFEGLVSINQSNRTAVISPMVRNNLVDYESSDSEHESPARTPYPKSVPKTPKPKLKLRAATPHGKKFMNLVRQKKIEELDTELLETKKESEDIIEETTPVRKENHLVPEQVMAMTTPTHNLNGLKSQIVTTSTPTHPATGGWSIFPVQGTDSPLSEIEGTTNGSPAQSIDNEPSKTETSSSVVPKLKSIITSGSRLKLGSQESSERQVTFQDSTELSNKTKRVKFAEDTVFEQENKIRRVFRKPKRMLTPGPQRPSARFCYNPRFQALINRFENQGITVARTPVTSNRERDEPESTPPIGEHSNMPARAINFKEDSAIVETDRSLRSADELFKSCVESPAGNPNPVLNTAITTLTRNLAGSLQSCLTTALKTQEQETEIQFKFVITKRKVSVKKVEDDGGGDVEIAETGRMIDDDRENIWSTVAKVVKNVFWKQQGNFETTTPINRASKSNDSTSSSGCKRKSDELSDSDCSPINHKRYKYEGRIRGRPPLHRYRTCGVSTLRTSHSAEHNQLINEMVKEETLNQSF